MLRVVFYDVFWMREDGKGDVQLVDLNGLIGGGIGGG